MDLSTCQFHLNPPSSTRRFSLLRSLTSPLALLSADPYPTSQDDVTRLLALLQDKDREITLYKQESTHREALVSRLTSSVDALSRELEAANKRAGGSGEDGVEHTWKMRCRDMEFQKNRVAVELSNAKFKVSFRFFAPLLGASPLVRSFSTSS
jgi:hypothetical protein